MFDQIRDIIVGTEDTDFFSGILCHYILNQFFHVLQSFRSVWVSKFFYNKSLIAQISYFVFKPKYSFERRPGFPEIIVDMNENFAPVLNEKICSQFATVEVVIVNLFEIPAGSFDGDYRNRERR